MYVCAAVLPTKGCDERNTHTYSIIKCAYYGTFIVLIYTENKRLLSSIRGERARRTQEKKDLMSLICNDLKTHKQQSGLHHQCCLNIVHILFYVRKGSNLDCTLLEILHSSLGLQIFLLIFASIVGPI